MYKKKKILAIIPARHGSKGLPRKNWKIINNKPLIFWTIKAAQRSKYIDDIILTTDSNIVIKIANKMGLNNFIKRPGYLSLDSTKSSEVILHTLKNVGLKKSIYDYFIFLEPTSPLRTYIDIDKSISKLCSSKATCLLSVAKNVNQSPEFLYTINKNFYLCLKNNIYLLYFCSSIIFSICSEHSIVIRFLLLLIIKLRPIELRSSNG